MEPLQLFIDSVFEKGKETIVAIYFYNMAIIIINKLTSQNRVKV